MFYWAGIDEAGYGPLLGPLVVAGTCFTTPGKPSEGFLWNALSDALTSSFKHRAGRLIVADSKEVYSAKKGIKNLEESVLSFAVCGGGSHDTAGSFFSALGHEAPDGLSPWFSQARHLTIPVAATRASVISKGAMLKDALDAGEFGFYARVCPVMPQEYNRIVARTRNKSLLLWQKCGLLLQHFREQFKGMDGFVLVDRHGGRQRYRKLLHEAFPHATCDVEREGGSGSVYRIRDRHNATMWVAFKAKADGLALPVALASMMAKYVRELYMLVFNTYWGKKVDGLKPTAGYFTDARRFLKDIQPVLDAEQTAMDGLVRVR